MDTIKINLAAESRPLIGPAVAGQMANEAAEKYSHKIVNDINLLDDLKRQSELCGMKRMFGQNFVEGRTVHRAAPPGGFTTPNNVGNATATNGGGLVPRGPGGAGNLNGIRPGIKYPSWPRGGHQELSSANTNKTSLAKKVIPFLLKYKIRILLGGLLLIAIVYVYYVYKRQKLIKQKIIALALNGSVVDYATI